MSTIANNSFKLAASATLALFATSLIAALIGQSTGLANLPQNPGHHQGFERIATPQGEAAMKHLSRFG
ncbi:MAG: hypothetical protein QM718_11425 [Steroidobacteraceae bacterium]